MNLEDIMNQDGEEYNADKLAKYININPRNYLIYTTWKDKIVESK